MVITMGVTDKMPPPFKFLRFSHVHTDVGLIDLFFFTLETQVLPNRKRKKTGDWCGLGV